MNGTTSTGALDFFDRVFRTFDRDLTTTCGGGNVFFTEGGSLYENRFPPMNVSVNPDTKDLLFEFALSGYKEEEVSVDFEEDYLHLSLDPKEPEDKKTYIKHGIKSSQCDAKYFVPSSKYEVNSSTAELKDGILTIFVPAKEEIKPKKIFIGKSPPKILE